MTEAGQGQTLHWGEDAATASRHSNGMGKPLLRDDLQP
jgi:hypothetical protein